MNASDWAGIVGNIGCNQYRNRIETLKASGIDTISIESTVEKTVTNLSKNGSRSFVIFGEPQSGKTETNARLLDEGYRIVVNLLTDSVDLLQQSLSRFSQSGLKPSPNEFSELPPDPQRLKGREWVIFCKKNARDLDKLITALRMERSLVVIDDEADYASPDGNINREAHEKTKINRLISGLLRDDGCYIGVTATPARLNLNTTLGTIVTVG
jgi:hypothetical protein